MSSIQSATEGIVAALPEDTFAELRVLLDGDFAANALRTGVDSEGSLFGGNPESFYRTILGLRTMPVGEAGSASDFLMGYLEDLLSLIHI